MGKKRKSAKKQKPSRRTRATSMWRFFTTSDFDELEDFNEFIKLALKREHKLTSRRIEEGAARLNAKEREQYYEIFSDDYYKIGAIFEKLALDSFVVMLYSLIEATMDSLCDALRQDRQAEKGETIELRPSDLKGGYLDRAKVYMEKLLGVNLNLDKNAQWPEIVGFRKLRNAIVHEEGWLRTKDASLRKHIDHSFIQLERMEAEDDGYVSGHIRVKSEYIDFILSEARKFVESISI